MKTPEIRHRRLHAFYESTVLNSLMLIAVISLLTLPILPQSIWALASGCASAAFLLFIGYSLWLWLKKPSSIRISPRLSNISGIYLLYWLIITHFYPENMWWYITPIIAAVPLTFLQLISRPSQPFDI